MIVPQEMLVEVGDETAWEVHDAFLLCTESASEGARKLRVCDGGPAASLSVFSRQSRKIAQEACTGKRGIRHGETLCGNSGPDD